MISLISIQVLRRGGGTMWQAQLTALQSTDSFSIPASQRTHGVLTFPVLLANRMYRKLKALLERDRVIAPGLRTDKTHLSDGLKGAPATEHHFSRASPNVLGVHKQSSANLMRLTACATTLQILHRDYSSPRSPKSRFFCFSYLF